MVDGPTPSGKRAAPRPDPLEPLDGDLTVFALANAMDLARERDGRPCRVLEWFREGMERTILIEPAPDGTASLSVGARPGSRRGEGGVARTLHEGLRPDALGKDLRPLLREALDAANAFTDADLT